MCLYVVLPVVSPAGCDLVFYRYFVFAILLCGQYYSFNCEACYACRGYQSASTAGCSKTLNKLEQGKKEKARKEEPGIKGNKVKCENKDSKTIESGGKNRQKMRPIWTTAPSPRPLPLPCEKRRSAGAVGTFGNCLIITGCLDSLWCTNDRSPRHLEEGARPTSTTLFVSVSVARSLHRLVLPRPRQTMMKLCPQVSMKTTSRSSARLGKDKGRLDQGSNSG
jgi:hypothetical protein